MMQQDGGLLEKARRVPAWALRAYGASVVVVAGLVGVNIMTLMHDAVARHGLPAWKVLTWELTSGLVIVLCAVLPLLALRLAEPGRGRWPRVIGVHVAASLLFSVLHVAGMAGLRMVVYRLFGESYDFGDTVSEFFYEYRKDVAAYALIAGIGWVLLRLEGGRREAGHAPVSPQMANGGGPVLEIKDGSRLVLVRHDEIVCAHAEGNYVSFTLADGRRPLMRTTLTALEQKLAHPPEADTAGREAGPAVRVAGPAVPEAGDGFVRTHRSWLVNLRHVRESAPSGSGDFVLRMTDGSTVPLSRRFGTAVRLLRKRPAA